VERGVSVFSCEHANLSHNNNGKRFCANPERGRNRRGISSSEYQSVGGLVKGIERGPLSAVTGRKNWEKEDGDQSPRESLFR